MNLREGIEELGKVSGDVLTIVVENTASAKARGVEGSYNTLKLDMSVGGGGDHTH